ncbi:hypothetical protein AZSI13_12780 [Azospira sp. I13]|uniref:hypothetical protein n=1 Tax=Azospira sp. I13 TaxID=1765050 RepID=UPI000D442674|nr:hypothetical protein [Azospira sp. I13]GBG01951.1 hypothetical protein AZSI13_12780 [Azospira sp. I13]
MNFRRFFTSLLLTLGLLWVLPAQAQFVTRVIPPQASAGKLYAVRQGQAAISNYVYRLAPGVQFRNGDNLIILSDTLANLGEPLIVRYTVDVNGDLFRVWILTPNEIANLDLRTIPPQPLPLASDPAMALPGRPATSSNN